MKTRILTTSVYTFITLIWCACSSDSNDQRVYSEGEDSLFIVENYIKMEYQVPMRDGIRLFTSVYVPTDESETYPILMVRTPYSVAPYGIEKNQYKTKLGPNSAMTREGYIYVFQDVRGQFMSEGKFTNMTPHETINSEGKTINESTDTFDTIEWLLSNIDGHNGKVGQWGISYPGFYTAAGMIDTHPALVAVSPQAPIADWFWDDFHHHGAFFLPHAFNFLTIFDQPKHGPTTEWPERFEYPTDDGYDFYLDLTPLSKVNDKYLGDSIQFWNAITEHPNYDDFWQKRNILPHLNNINCSVLTIGGWFDAEDLYGPLNIYKTIEENNPVINNTIVMGPWSHGGWARTDGEFLGNVYFGGKQSEFYNNEIITPFFKYHLKGEGEINLPEAFMFETGTNTWKKFETWPPENVKFRNLYFKKQRHLSYIPPRSNEYGTDEFMSDPRNPVPFINEKSVKMTKEYMTDDQKFVLDRKDVVYYQTDILKENLTLAGPIEANLIVSTDQSSADWVVKIIDVYPRDQEPFPHQPNKDMSNYHQMVRSEVMRGRFRNSYEKPEPFIPKETTEVIIPLQDVLHTFKKGHRIMVQIQSTWFPLVDINPQKYVDNIYQADSTDFTSATHRIGRAGVQPSYIKIGILEDVEPSS